MSESETRCRRSPLRETSGSRRDRRSDSSSSSRGSASPVVNFIDRLVHLRGTRSAKGASLHMNKLSRSRGGKCSGIINENLSSTYLLRNGQEMERILKKKTDKMRTVPRQSRDPRRSSNYLEDERAEVTSSTSKIPATDSRRLGEAPKPDARQFDNESNDDFMEVDKLEHWATTAETQATNSIFPRIQPPVEIPNSMDCHVTADVVNFSGIPPQPPIMDLNSVANIANYNPSVPNFFGGPFTCPPPLVTPYHQKRFKKTIKPKFVKPVLEWGRTGTMANYNVSEGFGFVTVDPDVGTLKIKGNVFVHHSGLKMESLTKGEKVKFDIAQGQRGYEAVNVSFASDED